MALGSAHRDGDLALRRRRLASETMTPPRPTSSPRATGAETLDQLGKTLFSPAGIRRNTASMLKKTALRTTAGVVSSAMVTAFALSQLGCSTSAGAPSPEAGAGTPDGASAYVGDGAPIEGDGGGAA